MDRLGPDIFSTLGMKGDVLHCACVHLKVPGSSLVWNARNSEINGGCEKILPVQWHPAIANPTITKTPL